MNNNNQQPLQSGVRWPVWLVIIILVSVTLVALQRRYDKNHPTVVQIHAELVTQQTTGEEPVVTNQASVAPTNGVAYNSNSLDPETVAGLEKVGLYGVKVTKINASVQPRQPVIIPNPLLVKTN